MGWDGLGIVDVFFLSFFWALEIWLTQLVAGHQLMDLSSRLLGSAWPGETKSMNDRSCAGSAKALAWRPLVASAAAA